MTRGSQTISETTQEAKHLRTNLAARGEAISQAQALERVAQSQGFGSHSDPKATSTARSKSDGEGQALLLFCDPGSTENPSWST